MDGIVCGSVNFRQVTSRMGETDGWEDGATTIRRWKRNRPAWCGIMADRHWGDGEAERGSWGRSRLRRGELRSAQWRERADERGTGRGHVI